MGWIRLYMTVEGSTEREFAETVLKPHLAQFSVGLFPRILVTNRKQNKRGGLLNFATFRNDLTRLMSQNTQADVRFTTMIDLYALPKDFPGWAEADHKNIPTDRVTTLEAALQAEFNNYRFIPYIQLHEFEALLYCDLSQLAARIEGAAKPLAELAQEVADLAPEEINEGERTAPSKRIINYLPLYDRVKVRVGAPAAAAIGLATLRQLCPHFNDWISKLERLSQSP